ncbi:MAG: hypothetical protein V3U73_05325 [bacterium]
MNSVGFTRFVNKPIGIVAFIAAIMVCNPTMALDRFYQPVVVKGVVFGQMSGAPLDRLSLMAYGASTNTWKQIPFQIDQVSEDGSYFDQKSGLLEDSDEMVFMAKDLGDEAPSDNWPEFNGNSIVGRYKVSFSDPLAVGGETACVYLYLLTAPIQTSSDDFIQVDHENDRIKSRFYEMGFDNNNGLPVDLQITLENGGDNQDFMDRLKLRMKGQVSSPGFPALPLLFDEETGIIKVDSSGLENPKVLDGPIRAVRDVLIKLQISVVGLGPLELPDQYTFRIYFFPYSMLVNFKGLNFSLLKEVNGQLNLLRVSFDNNERAIGMKFMNPLNTQIIDGNSDNNVDSSLTVPGSNWSMATGNGGSMLTITLVPDIGDKQLLYYYDNQNGGSADGTDDTGDHASYGDAGFMVRNNITSGAFDFISTSHFLPANMSREQAEALFQAEQSPLQFEQALFETQTTDVADNQPPNSFLLLETYPNPYSLQSRSPLRITLNLTERENIAFSLVNTLGQVVLQRKPASVGAGSHELTWDLAKAMPDRLSSGLYWLVARGESARLVRKIVILR